MRIGKLRAAEAAYRRECICGGSALARRRTFPTRAVTWFWRVLAAVFAVTVADVAGFDTAAAQAVENVWRAW